VQIENVLCAHAGVAEAAVVAVPDATYGEVVGAWVVRAPSPPGRGLGPEDIRRVVAEGMNPQVRPCPSLLPASPFFFLRSRLVCAVC
jgi:acyl-coenzyme A synthetase/AMP-(fatty) acid ligase